MKFKLILIMFFAFSAMQSNAQNITIQNGVLKFSTLAVYQQYADNTLNQDDISSLAASSSSLTTLAELPNAEDDTLNPEFIQTILNTDKIVQLGDFLVKIDLENHQALAIAANASNAYSILTANNTTASGVMVFSDEDDNAMDVLEAVQAGTISAQNYATGFTDRCRRPGKQSAKQIIVWRTVVGDNSVSCNNNTTAYAMDNKVVYQKAIFYFSLQSKVRSLKGCTYSNWIFVPTSNQPLKLIASAKYRVRCGGEVNKTKEDVTVGTVLSWRGYQGSRGLSHFDFSAKFGIGDTDRNPNPTPNYYWSPDYRIVDGY
jgi:hypothetical protein